MFGYIATVQGYWGAVLNGSLCFSPFWRVHLQSVEPWFSNWKVKYLRKHEIQELKVTFSSSNSRTVDGDTPTERSYAAIVPRETHRMPRRVKKQVKRTSGNDGASRQQPCSNDQCTQRTSKWSQETMGHVAFMITCTTVKNTIAHLTKLVILKHPSTQSPLYWSKLVMVHILF